MTVYILVDVECGDPCSVQVFTSRTLAEQNAKEFGLNDYEIVESSVIGMD